jgi:hypothetical protein
VFVAFCLATSVGEAQEISVPAPSSSPNWKPTQLQIDQFFGALLICETSGASITVKSEAERAALGQYVEQKLLASANADGVSLVNFSAFGVHFTEVNVAVAFSAWSPTGNRDDLAKALRARGFTLVDESIEINRGHPQPALTSAKITTDEKQQLLLLEGKLNSGENSPRKGVSLTCVPTSPTDAEVQAATGLPSTRSILRKLSINEKLSKDIVDQLIERGGPQAVQALTRYQWLDADQVEALLASKLPTVRVGLLRNRNAALSVQQIDQIIRAGEKRELLVLISTRYDTLNAQQREQLARQPVAAPYMTVRAGDGAAVKLLTKLIKDGDDGQFPEMLSFFPALNDEVVYLILRSGTPKMRRNLTMSSAFNYNAEQKELILQDPDRDVQIGLLRRKDVQLTDAQVARGINHRDVNLAFWYRQVKGYVPTAEQIEIGLMASDASTRAGWAFDERISITQLQAQRGLADPSTTVVIAILRRADIALTEANLDACTAHSDVSVRFACVRRADYTLTQKRFEQIATDTNSNVLRFFLERKNVPPIDVNPFLDEALRTASEDVLLAMAANQALLLTAEQINLVLAASVSPRVKQAFARRLRSTQIGTKQN